MATKFPPDSYGIWDISWDIDDTCSGPVYSAVATVRQTDYTILEHTSGIERSGSGKTIRGAMIEMFGEDFDSSSDE